MAWSVRTFWRYSFRFIFQDIHQTFPLPLFFPCQKRFKKWSKLQFLNCFMGHSYTLNRLPDGYAKSCKVTPKYTKITAKWARKTMDHAFAIAKNIPHRLTCQNASKCDRFCCSRSCIASGKCAEITQMDQKMKRNSITKWTPLSRNRRIISNARREGGQFEVYTLKWT